MDYVDGILIIVAVLVILYAFLKRRDNLTSINTIGEFSERSRGKNPLTEEEIIYSNAIIKQKIVHKNIAFYAYLVSLIISFGLGTYLLYKIINKELEWKLIKDVLSISAGTVATVSFRNLYDKCSREINQLTRQRSVPKNR